MNILFINLARFGDLLQSQAAIADFSRQGHTVGIICLENFFQATTLLPGVTYAKALPCSALLASLGPSPEVNKDAWRSGLAHLGAWRETVLDDFEPDIICNLTPSLSARLLASFVAKDKPRTGFTVDDHGFWADKNAWSGFLQAASAVRGVSPFNIVDMFRKVAESWPESGDQYGDVSLKKPPEEIISSTKKLLLSEAPSGHQGFVAFQLGASLDIRRWPLNHFVELGNILWNEARLCPVLLGSKAERPLADRYKEGAKHPFIDMCGKTGLTELAAVIGQTRLIVTNDTGTMHLAAGLGCPVLAVFLATAQPFDTGPYRAGSCSVEPDLSCHPCAFNAACGKGHACRHAISPEFLSELVMSYSKNGQWGLQEQRLQAPARVWVSRFDEHGFMALEPLSDHAASPRTVWLSILHHHIRRFLDIAGKGEFQPTPFPGTPALPVEMKNDIASAAQKTVTLAMLLLQQGRVLSSNPVPLMRERFMATWQKVMDALGQTPHFSALSMIWTQLTQAPGQDLPGVLAVAEDFIKLLDGINTDITRFESIE